MSFWVCGWIFFTRNHIIVGQRQCSLFLPSIPALSLFLRPTSAPGPLTRCLRKVVQEARVPPSEAVRTALAFIINYVCSRILKYARYQLWGKFLFIPNLLTFFIIIIECRIVSIFYTNQDNYIILNLILLMQRMAQTHFQTSGRRRSSEKSRTGGHTFPSWAQFASILRISASEVNLRCSLIYFSCIVCQTWATDRLMKRWGDGLSVFRRNRRKAGVSPSQCTRKATQDWGTASKTFLVTYSGMYVCVYMHFPNMYCVYIIYAFNIGMYMHIL